MHAIEVSLKTHLPDARGLGLVKDIRDLSISSVSNAHVLDVYWLDADLPKAKVELICRGLLADNVTQDYWHGKTSRKLKTDATHHVVEVAYNPGVTDPAADTVMKAIGDLGIDAVKAVRTGKKYLIEGKLSLAQLDLISRRLLINPVIQHVTQDEEKHFAAIPPYTFKLNRVELLKASKAELQKIAKEQGFSEGEFTAIVAYFKEQKRNPTDVELETLAQTWSEHCVHKTFKAKITYGKKVINNLLKSTIIKATNELNKPWCLSVFVDNAGVIDFDGKNAICFKVETHNHPSAIEPYGGAMTGVGGVVRDPLGTGLGAKPILNTDVFCFAPPDMSYDKLPPGVLHPRRIFKGVRAGVADYGNRLGIPTLNGAILFDERYVGNPLVFCGTVGIMPKKDVKQGLQKPGDKVVLIGGKTGRDGIHGVTFASVQLTGESVELSSTAVQIGNPIVEKKVIDVLLQARDRGLYRRITDCGGGGLSSAVGEMGAETGVHVNLDKVPLKYAGLTYSEIWVSEAQERMIIAVPPKKVDEVLQLCASENVEAAVIGEFTGDHKLQLFYQNDKVCDMGMDFLHDGRPQLQLKGTWKQPKHAEPDFASPKDLGKDLLNILGSLNVASKEWVIRQYDHEVQGGNVLKPLVGVNSDGPGDAAIIRPLLNSDRGIIVSNGINPRYAEIDPYWMAASVIDEALRQVIAVGGNLNEVALLDNFCWGNAFRPEIMGALVRAAEACHDMSLSYGTPFISGKDSLNNEFQADGKRVVIPHTLLISAMGIIEDVNKAVTMDFKEAGNSIYVVGATYNELGGSEYLKAHDLIGNTVPKVNAQTARETMVKLSQATAKGLVRACHDCSDGGIGVALAEMAFAGGLGATIDLKSVPLAEAIERDDYILFSESNSRFLVEVAPLNKAKFERIMQSSSFAAIGQVTDSGKVVVKGLSGKNVVNKSIADLKEAWQKPLRW